MTPAERALEFRRAVVARCRAGRPGEGFDLDASYVLGVVHELAQQALQEAVEDEREECALLMEGGANKPGTFTQSEFCRLVDHAQDICECSDRAAAIRARGDAKAVTNG